LLCQRYRQEHAAAAGYYAEGLAASPVPVAELKPELLYEAACAAALAGCGQGKDAVGLAPTEKTRLRTQALDWLRAALASWKGKVGGDRPGPLLDLTKHLSTWQTDPALAGVREVKGLGKLPAAERKAWEGLWAEVAGLLKDAEARFRAAGRWEGILDGKRRERAQEVS